MCDESLTGFVREHWGDAEGRTAGEWASYDGHASRWYARMKYFYHIVIVHSYRK